MRPTAQVPERKTKPSQLPLALREASTSDAGGRQQQVATERKQPMWLHQAPFEVSTGDAWGRRRKVWTRSAEEASQQGPPERDALQKDKRTPRHQGHVSRQRLH